MRSPRGLDSTDGVDALRRGLAAAPFAAAVFGERGARGFAPVVFDAPGLTGAFGASVGVLRAAFFAAAGFLAGVSDGGSVTGAGVLGVVGFFLDKTL